MNIKFKSISKMSDSIKFGPEWLRNMSNDTSNLSSSASATLAAAGGGGTGVNLSTYTNSRMYFVEFLNESFYLWRARTLTEFWSVLNDAFS